MPLWREQFDLKKEKKIFRLADTLRMIKHDFIFIYFLFY